MRKHILQKRIALILLFFFIFTNIAFGMEAKLVNFNVTNTGDDLLVYFNVEGAFHKKIEEAILSGVPTTFSFFINLFKVRNFWPDEKFVHIAITHTIKYDTLKKEFSITRSYENNETKLVKTFSEAKAVMTNIDGLKVVSLDKLIEKHQYQLRAKAQLSKLTLPFYLHYILFFVSLWDFETDWYTIDFIY